MSPNTHHSPTKGWIDAVSSELVILNDGTSDKTPHQWAAEHPQMKASVRAVVCPASATRAYVQVGIVPRSVEQLQEEAAGWELKASCPTIVAAMKKEDGTLATGREAVLAPLEVPGDTCTGSVLKPLFFLAGVAELETAPNTARVVSSVRNLLSSLKKGACLKTFKDWESEWNKDSWEDVPQPVSWPPHVPAPQQQGEPQGQYQHCKPLGVMSFKLSSLVVWRRYGSKYSGNRSIMTVDEQLMSRKNVAPVFQDLAISLLSSTRSRSAWKQTNTVRNKIEAVALKHGLDLNFPWDSSKKLNFTLALLQENLKVSTIKNYNSQCNVLHTLLGHPTPPDDPILKSLIRGGEHIQDPSRKVLAITPRVLHILRDKLKARKDWSATDRKMVWAVCTIMYSGSLRVNEALCQGRDYFTEHDLVGDRIKVIEEPIDGQLTKMIVLSLYCPKETRGAPSSANVEIFEQPGHRLCPVRALSAWLSSSKLKLEPGVPAFRWSSGKAFTRNDLHLFLKAELSHLETDSLKVATHGFRAGVVTMLSLMGESESTIEIVGRWRSQAWMAYCRYGRAKRKQDAVRLAGKIMEAAQYEGTLTRGLPDIDIA